MPQEYLQGGSVAYPLPAIMGRVPREAIRDRGPEVGFGFFDDFTGASAPESSSAILIAGWQCDHIANAGTITASGLEGGGIVLTDAGTENDGMNIQKPAAYVIDTDVRIAFGARILITDITEIDLFIGLATIDTDLAQSHPNDHVGFYIADDGDGSIYYTIDDGGTGPTATDTTTDAENATAISLEGFIDRESGVELYVDGTKIDATITYLPEDTAMGLGISFVCGTSTPNPLTVMWAYTWQWFAQR